MTEGLVAVLHYRVTTLLIMGCCILVTALDWIGNGNSITCVMEGDSDSWTIPPKVTRIATCFNLEMLLQVINTYCYIMSTFTLPRALAGDVGKDVAAPGVGAYDSKTDTYTVKVTSPSCKQEEISEIFL